MNHSQGLNLLKEILWNILDFFFAEVSLWIIFDVEL